MKPLNYNQRKFWQSVFVAAITSGTMSSNADRAALADDAVAELDKRSPPADEEDRPAC